eukprot:354195_1
MGENNVSYDIIGKREHDNGDIFQAFQTKDITISLSLSIPEEITINLYQPLIRSLFSFAKSFSKKFTFPIIHSSKRYGYDKFRNRQRKTIPNIMVQKCTKEDNIGLSQILAGIWINYILINKTSIHLWYRDDSIPSDAITFSLKSFKFTGEIDKINKNETVKSDSWWKMTVIPNFIRIHNNIWYYMENNKLSINDIEIRTTRNKMMNETLKELNPMKSTIEGHIVICEIWENERRYGLKWSKQLLPTDRPKWSAIDGYALDKDKDFILPKDWFWVTPWDWKWSTILSIENDKIIKDKLDKKKNKYKCDSNGWQYAFDFPEKKNWTSKPSILTHTRRRRWIRIRRYQQSMKSARDRFRQKDSQPMKLFKADEFIKLSNICYLQSNEIKVKNDDFSLCSGLDPLREESKTEISKETIKCDINKIFNSIRTAPKQRCLNSISKRHLKLSLVIHDKPFINRDVCNLTSAINAITNNKSQNREYTVSTIQTSNTITSTSLSSSHIIITPNRGTMRLSNWNQSNHTPSFGYPDSGFNSTGKKMGITSNGGDISYFESQLIKFENENDEKKCNDEDVRLGAVLIDKENEWLNKPSVQCSLSRWVYENEYVESLKDCVMDVKSEIYKQLYNMHLRHVNTLKEANKTTGLIQIVEWLKNNKPNKDEAICWDSI